MTGGKSEACHLLSGDTNVPLTPFVRSRLESLDDTRIGPRRSASVSVIDGAVYAPAKIDHRPPMKLARPAIAPTIEAMMSRGRSLVSNVPFIV